MTLRTAAFLALVGMLLLSVLLAVDLIRTILAVAHDVLPPLALVRSLVDFFAGVTVTIFFFVFSRGERGGG